MNALSVARQSFVAVVEFMIVQGKSAANEAYAGSVLYLIMAGELIAGWQLARSALAAYACINRGFDTVFLHSKIRTAQYFAEHVLSQARGHETRIIDGGASVLAITPEQL